MKTDPNKVRSLYKEPYGDATADFQSEVERLATTIDWKEARKTLFPPQAWFDGDEPKPF